jgi:hypothetical protein
MIIKKRKTKLKKLVNITVNFTFCWPCIIMYHSNVMLTVYHYVSQ